MNSTKPEYHDDLERINPSAAGIDIGASEMFVAVPPDRDPKPIRAFGTFTEDLQEIARWLIACRVSTVAMESTGIYWIPLWQVLEEHDISVVLVDAHKVKNVSGRKSDVSDAEWLRTLHMYGLTSGCFRPDVQVRTLRAYVRHRHSLQQQRNTQVSQMYKALTQMNLQLKQVVSDLTGTTGLRIIRAICQGERDPAVLAEHRDGRLKASSAQIVKALDGHWDPEHLFTLRQSLELFDSFSQKIDECDQQILEYLESLEPNTNAEPPSSTKRLSRGSASGLHTALFRVVGVDLTRIDGINLSTAVTLMAEIGWNVEAWPTEKHFCSWLGLAPNTATSGGKHLRRYRPAIANRAGQALRIAAYGVQRSHSAMGAFYRSARARLGPGKAIKATAHRIARAVYRAMRFGTDYVDIGETTYQQRALQRREIALRKNAERLGFTLVPIGVS